MGLTLHMGPTQLARRTVCVLGLCLAAACQTVTPETLNQDITDAAITAAVKTRIVTDPRAPVGQVDIETVRGHVYLTGVVPTFEEKRLAHAMALEVPGVLTVANKLRVDQSEAMSVSDPSSTHVPITREVQGEILHMEGEDLVVRDRTDKEVRLQVDSRTEMLDPVRVGDKIQADIAFGNHADRIRKLQERPAP